MNCPACRGRGGSERVVAGHYIRSGAGGGNRMWVSCTRCGGSGTVWSPSPPPPPPPPKCPDCEGRAAGAGPACARCGGTGLYRPTVAEQRAAARRRKRDQAGLLLMFAAAGAGYWAAHQWPDEYAQLLAWGGEWWRHALAAVAALVAVVLAVALLLQADREARAAAAERNRSRWILLPGRLAAVAGRRLDAAARSCLGVPAVAYLFALAALVGTPVCLRAHGWHVVGGAVVAGLAAMSAAFVGCALSFDVAPRWARLPARARVGAVSAALLCGVATAGGAYLGFGWWGLTGLFAGGQVGAALGGLVALRVAFRCPK